MNYQIHGTSEIDGRTLVMGEGNTEAEELLKNLTSHWAEDEIGTPYKRSMKQ